MRDRALQIRVLSFPAAFANPSLSGLAPSSRKAQVTDCFRFEIVFN